MQPKILQLIFPKIKQIHQKQVTYHHNSMLLTVETNKSIAWTEWTSLAPLYELGVLANATGRARSVSIIQAQEIFQVYFLIQIKANDPGGFFQGAIP